MDVIAGASDFQKSTLRGNGHGGFGAPKPWSKGCPVQQPDLEGATRLMRLILMVSDGFNV